MVFGIRGLDFTIMLPYYSFFVSGVMYTLLLSTLATLFGLAGGTLLAVGRTSKNKIISKVVLAYIAFIRGTPLLVQLYLVYYGIPGIDMVMAGIIALSINSCAYIAEIIRAGIGAVDHGQVEAASSLGLNQYQCYKEIILPQALKNILPALGNELVVLIKESAIVSVIGVHDLMYNADTIRGITYHPYEPLIIVAVIYFILTAILGKGVGVLERRLAASD